MTSKSLSVAKDFSPSPAGRFRSDGRFSGEQFREDLLLPALMASDEVFVDFDGTDGYGSSFLEEAFGGLVRSGVPYAELEKKLKINSSRSSYLFRAWKYMQQAKSRA